MPLAEEDRVNENDAIVAEDMGPTGETGGGQVNPRMNSLRISQVKETLTEKEQQILSRSSIGSEVDLHEVVKQISNTEDAKKQTLVLRKFVFALVIALIVMAAALFGVTFMAVEITKESHIKGSVMVDTNNKPVSTAAVKSYTSLFELVSFDTRTLSALNTITLQLQKGGEVTLHVQDVHKQPGSKFVTIYSSSGNQLTIDTVSMIAVAKIGGTSHIVKASARRARLLKENTPRLYSESDFFVAENGFVGTGSDPRRLAENDVNGWAEILMVVGDAILDEVADPRPEDNVYISGQLTVITSAGGKSQAHNYELFYPRDNPETEARFRIQDPSGKYHLVNPSQGYHAIFDEGRLIDCKSQGKITLPDEMTDIKNVVQQGGGLVVGAKDDWTVIVDQIRFNTDELKFPHYTECLKLTSAVHVPMSIEEQKAQHDADVELLSPSGNDRRLSNNSRRLSPTMAATPDQLWWAAFGSYKIDTPDYNFHGWNTLWKCETGNAFGRVMYRWDGAAPVIVLGLAGTSGLSDIGDWYDNANIWPKSHNGKVYHSGFYNYAKALKDCFNGHVGTLASWGYQIDYVVGHSLGGAAATVYEQAFAPSGVPARGVYTYGSPKTRYHSTGGCTTSGKRFYHSHDPVPSDILGFFSVLKHDVSSAYEVGESCSWNPHWKGWYWCAWCTTCSKYCSYKGCHAVSNSGCWNLIQCGWNFGSVHGIYNQFPLNNAR